MASDTKRTLIVLAVIALLIAGFVGYLQATDTPCNTSKCHVDRWLEQNPERKAK